MNLMYHSTRNGSIKATASQAILQGLAPDGGLFVPEVIPQLTIPIKSLLTWIIISWLMKS